MLHHCERWQTRVKLKQLTSVTFKNRPQNALNYIKSVLLYCIVNNNNCIHVNKGEIQILFGKLQGKTSYALRGSEGIVDGVDSKYLQQSEYTIYLHVIVY